MDRFLGDMNLPEEIKELFLSLATAVAYLNMEWGFYKTLFDNDKNSALLADTARTFFTCLEQVLRDDIALGICNLSYQSEYKKPSGAILYSFSLETLINRCSPSQSVLDTFSEFRKKARPFEKLRNTRIAHRELNAALDPSANPLPQVNQTKVDTVLALAGEVLLGIAQQYGNVGAVRWEPLVATGADKMIFWLNEGWDSHRRRMEELGGRSA